MPPRVDYWRFQWRDVNGFGSAWRKHRKLIILSNLGLLSLFFALLSILSSRNSVSSLGSGGSGGGTWLGSKLWVNDEAGGADPKNVIVRIEKTVHAPYPLEERISSLFNQYKLVHESCLYVLQSRCQNGRLLSAPGRHKQHEPHQAPPKAQSNEHDNDDDEKNEDDDQDDICRAPPLVNGTLHRTTLALLTNIYTDMADTTAHHIHTHRRTYRTELLALYQHLKQNGHSDDDVGLAQALLIRPVPNNKDDNDEDRHEDGDLDAGGQASLVGPGFMAATEAMQGARRAVRRVSGPAQAVETMAEIMLGVQTTWAARLVGAVRVGWDFSHQGAADDGDEARGVLKLVGSGRDRGEGEGEGEEGTSGGGDGSAEFVPGLEDDGKQHPGSYESHYHHYYHRDGGQRDKAGGSDDNEDDDTDKTFYLPDWMKNVPSKPYDKSNGLTRQQWDHWMAKLVLRYLFGKDGPSWDGQKERQQQQLTLDNVDKTDLEDVSSALAQLLDSVAPVEAHLVRFEQVTAAWYAGEELGLGRVQDEDKDEDYHHDMMHHGVNWLTQKFQSSFFFFGGKNTINNTTGTTSTTIPMQQAQKETKQRRRQRRRRQWDELRRVRILTQLALTDITQAQELLQATMKQWDDLARDLIDLVNKNMVLVTTTHTDQDDKQVGLKKHRSVTITVYTLPEPLVILDRLLGLISELLAYQEGIGKVRDKLRSSFPVPEFE